MLLLTIFLLSGCTTNQSSSNSIQSLEQTQPPTPAQNAQDLPVPTSTSTPSNSTNVTGEYFYYPTPEKTTISGYKTSALRRVCFEPAQLETVNGGFPFCFRNTVEAMNLLNIQDSSADCRVYWGGGTVQINNLSQKNISNRKDDTCLQTGTCEFNEADLLSIIEIDFSRSEACSK